jgi:hypothetical protein
LDWNKRLGPLAKIEIMDQNRIHHMSADHLPPGAFFFEKDDSSLTSEMPTMRNSDELRYIYIMGKNRREKAASPTEDRPGRGGSETSGVYH